jgi:hypothetical protein
MRNVVHALPCSKIGTWGTRRHTLRRLNFETRYRGGEQMNGYLVRWKSRAEDDHRTIDYWFSTSPKDGATRGLLKLAEIDMREFNRNGVTIPSSLGGNHVIHDFSVEKRDDGKIVVCCDAPFILQDCPGQIGGEL